MAFKYRWSLRASRDLNRVIEYLDSRDPCWTNAVTTAIADRLEALAESPFLSSIYQTSSRGEVREVLVMNYRLFFHVNEQRQIVHLEAIRHVRQQDPDFSE